MIFVEKKTFDQYMNINFFVKLTKTVIKTLELLINCKGIIVYPIQNFITNQFKNYWGSIEIELQPNMAITDIAFKYAVRYSR